MAYSIYKVLRVLRVSRVQYSAPLIPPASFKYKILPGLAFQVHLLECL